MLQTANGWASVFLHQYPVTDYLNTEASAIQTSVPSNRLPETSPLICSVRAHYKERLVELINRCHGDPAVLFSPAEMRAELQRWNVAVPTRKPDEPEVLYAHRLRMVSDINIVIIISSSTVANIHLKIRDRPIWFSRADTDYW